MTNALMTDTFMVTVSDDWASVAAGWRELLATADATPFQRFAWLDAWYCSIGPAIGVTPKLVTVTDARSGGLVMLLPLVSKYRRAGVTLEFADDDLSDFNAPVLGPVSVLPGAEGALWAAIVAALPSHTAAVFRKMPYEIAGRSNPLAKLAGAQVSSLAGNLIRFDDQWQAYRDGLNRRVRMELDRCWRVLQRETKPELIVARDEATALAILDVMDLHQRQRLEEIGASFRLDQPAEAALYRHDLAARLAKGQVFLSCLKANGEIIAALYAVQDKATTIVLRISHAGRSWSRISPGRLVVFQSLELLHAAGVRQVDLSIGDYDYKRRLGVTRIPLVDLVTALSWRGKAVATRHWAVGTLRAYPALDGRLRAIANRLKPQPAVSA